MKVKLFCVFFFLTERSPPAESWCRLSTQQMSVVRRVHKADLNAENRVCFCDTAAPDDTGNISEALQVNKLCLFINCQPESCKI